MSVSIVMVRALIEAIERAGVSREKLLAAVGLDSDKLDELEVRISMDDFRRVQLFALELTRDEALGLHLGEQATCVAYDLLGHLYEHAATLRQSIESVMYYQSLINAGPEPSLHEEDGVATLCYAFPRIDSPSIRMESELAMCGHWANMRLFVGPDVKPRGVFFSYPAPNYTAEYRRIFGGRERFEHEFTGISFDSDWLDYTRLHKNSKIYSLLKEQADRALTKINRDNRQSEVVLEYLVSLDPRQMPSMDQVGQHFGISGRSLRRKLAAEGVQYMELVREARAVIAKHLLERPYATIHEAAYTMGFATPTAFHRAFKRWTGMTPKEYVASC